VGTEGKHGNRGVKHSVPRGGDVANNGERGVETLFSRPGKVKNCAQILGSGKGKALTIRGNLGGKEYRTGKNSL